MRTPLDDASASVTCKTSTTTTAGTTRASSDVLIVLDRSASMNWSLTADDTCRASDRTCSSRLDAVVSAVGRVVADNPRINWGLEFFSTPGASSYCAVVGSPQVKVGPSNAGAIDAQLAGFTTSLSTPTRAALEVATAYLGTVGDGNGKAILLATDGLPTCAIGQSWDIEDMPGATAAAAAARRTGFPVYVIGMGPGKSIDNLNALAQAGGTGSYYPVTSTAELNAALSAIAKVASSTCTFKASQRPSDGQLVHVYVDKHLVPEDDGDGWTFDGEDPTHSTITLTGTYCQAMLAGDSALVQIVLGCPGTTPPVVLP